MNIRLINKSNNPMPAYQTNGSAGVDLQAFIDQPITLMPMERKVIPTGLFIEIPQGYEGQVRARSGLSLKHGITMANGVGTIDSDYRGELGVILVNISNEPFVIQSGDRIAQLIITKYERVVFDLVEELTDTKRATGGYGHTGL